MDSLTRQIDEAVLISREIVCSKLQTSISLQLKKIEFLITWGIFERTVPLSLA